MANDSLLLGYGFHRAYVPALSAIYTILRIDVRCGKFVERILISSRGNKLCLYSFHKITPPEYL
jgi:hypothetical protein